MYRVIKAFVDLQDGNHKYNVGDIYPRENAISTPARLAQLAGVKNRQGVSLIEHFDDHVTAPAQLETVEQETPLEEIEKPKKSRKHKEE